MSSPRAAWFVCFIFLLGLTASTLVVDVPLDCQAGWTNIGAKCYRLFRDVLPWESADMVCQSYGSRLVEVKDYYENEDIGQFVKGEGATEYWIGTSRRNTQGTNERALKWSDGEDTTVAVGYWQDVQPDTDNGKCVMARLVNGRALWSLASCERKTPYICQRPAAPEGSFHCHNGRFVRKGLTCDGDDDCGDGSDELSCSNKCSFHIKNQLTGTVRSRNAPNVYPNKQTCTWLIELQLGYNVRLQFTNFKTESRMDEVQVLTGGMTVPTSKLVARLSGNLSSPLPMYTSRNNLMMIVFSTDDNMSDKGFQAQFSAVKDVMFPTVKKLVATRTPEPLQSPMYPSYLGSQDYTWVITAETKVKIVTLEIVEVDLKGGDRILIRDGDKVDDDLLVELTSTSLIPPYVLSTGRNLYITMQTRMQETGKGFRFNYWEGCTLNLTSTSGEIHSPGYRSIGGQYGVYQVCTFDVFIPGHQVTVRFDRMKLHQSDEVMVYQGNQLLYNVTGTAAPPPFLITTGSFRVIFDSDAIWTDEGFSITYSVACANPQFNDKTIVTPPTTEYKLGTRVTVSCKIGHAFSALEFQDTSFQDAFEPLKQVDLECMAGGTWNLRTLPLCEPRYCGQAPAVSNAYVVQATGVTYMSTVRYKCYQGFAMQGVDTIRCTDTGGWTNTPLCQTAACHTLPTTIIKGTSVVRAGDGTNFGSIVEYMCQPGYQIIGHPILFCTSDGMWSSNTPACEILRCYVPPIPNGELSATGSIEVGQIVTASCKFGYVSNVPGGGTAVGTCHSDRSLTGLDGFECTYQDKCVSEPNYCAQLCHDSEFENRTCSCKEGFTLASDMRSCDNINECENNTAVCDHTCQDTPNGYQCSCDPGYILFTFDGSNGYRLAPNEDGKRLGDIRRLNHTCLPKLCPNPPYVANGDLMVNLSSYHYGDSVEYTCKLGFKLSGYKLLTCNQQGQWDRAAPRCDPATCPPDTIPPGTVRNLANIYPRTAVGLGEIVTLSCKVPGKAPFNKTRTCIFHEGKYQLMGADYECGLIDCGQPPTVAGSLYSGVNTSDTTYGARFQFGCQNLYSPSGKSEANDLTVRCMQDGSWGLGSLQCEGMRCQDPGTPPDGHQVNTTSYDQNDLVYYACDEEGFTPDNLYPLLCRLNAAGNGLEWNATVPKCIDTQKPVFSGCPNETVSVPRYSRANEVLTMPTATDNVAVTKIRMTTAQGLDIWFSNDLILDALMIFDITATDPSGNTAKCQMMMNIIDDVPPINECPANMIKEFRTEGEKIEVQFTSSLLNFSDSSGTAPPVFTPSSVDFTASQAQLQPTFPPYRSFNIFSAVQDLAGNPTNCNFELMIRPESCSSFSLRTPLHGQKNCQTLPGDQVQCVLSCDSGYVFYEMPGNATITYTCNRGDNWNVPSTPACVRANDTNQQADYRQTFRFVFNKHQSVMCSDANLYKTLLQNVLTDQVTPLLDKACFITGVTMRGVLSVTDIVDLSNQVTVNITLNYDRESILCNESVAYNFHLPNGELTRPLRENFVPLGCPNITTTLPGQLMESEYYCTTGKKIEYQSAGSSHSVCVVCPEGTRTVGTTCELCPVGTFSALPGRTDCNGCPAGTSTFREGAVSNGECTDTCAPGRYSPSGLPPCKLCPKNTYSSNNSTHCTPCPDGFITRQAGSTKSEQCLPPCGPGTYNPVDGHGDSATVGCKTCPHNFYADGTGNRLCKECDYVKTNNVEGAISISSCIDNTGCNASNNPCKNNGRCHISLHAVFCECPDGYNGQYCDQKVSPCSSSPCYRGAQCSVNGDTFSCNCPQDSSGNQCEFASTFCNPNLCHNGGACRNDLGKATCLCKPGFSGSMCTQTQPICQPNPCFNGGTCVSHENVRFRCECTLGYGGPTCNINLDDCDPNLCLHGGNCTDMVNNFQCSCPYGFSGKNCQNRQRLCDTVTCNTGQCVEDYEANTYRCVCPEGNYYGNVCQYEAYFGYDVNGSAVFVFNANNVSIEDCKAKCEAERCRQFIYDNSSKSCKIVDPREGLSIGDGGAIYYHRRCTDVEESYWTPWYDSFLPNSDQQSGDDEMLSSLNMFGLNICDGTEPVDAQCQVVRTQAPSNETLFINCSPTQGLLCFNINQTDKQCENYEIRFKCLSSRVFSSTPCKDINYCSNASVCVNGGSCSEAPTGPNCTCSPGYSGSHCQHNKDDCASNPCKNNGKCMDQFGGFKCECMPGFGGVDCSVNINECLSNPCSIPGTERCKDGIGSFQCVCNPGFTGKLCDLDINECESQPCLHRGICVNQQNNFTCNCSAGWTGHMCESKVEKCQPDTCSNGADCNNLFNDFYCGCLPNTFGKTCSNAPSICQNANPCIHGSSCSENKGVASCECPLEYTGRGCEFRQDVCSTPDVVCKNGATCSSSLQNFTCECPPGYTGKYCDQNIDDCQFNSCPGSTCIDIPNGYMCRCPVGRAGDNCEKEVNREFDLLFNEPEKNNMAAMGYPLRLTGEGFSITMWIQYKQKGGKGTFFTLYQVSGANSLVGKRELIRLDEKGLTLSLDQTPAVLNTTVDYNKDGLWHYIVLSWNKTSGRFSFFVDTIRIPMNNYQTGQPLDLYVWMVLGCHYDTSTDMCQKNEGFNGYISQVSLYDRELIFKDELTILGNKKPYHVFPDAIMTWGEFLLYPGVTRVYPSIVDKSCPFGFTGYKTCTTPIPGKTAVNIDHNSCPGDIIKYSKSRVTKISWPDISFSGQAGHIKSSLASDTVFLWGKYPVVVEAANDDGNKALCTFDIYVQYDRCSTPKTPKNAGQVFCANFTDPERRGYRQCSVSCQPNHKVVVPSPKIHTCGPVGSWDPPNRYLPYTLPPCGRTSAPQRRLKVVIVYNIPSGECAQVQVELRKLMMVRLQQQNSGWSSGLCKKTDCSDIVLEFKCQTNTPSGKRRKRQTDNTRIEVTITAEDVPPLLTSTSNSFKKISPEDLLQQLVLSDSVFDFTNRIADATPDPNGLDVKVELQCQAPKALIANQCVQCAPGSYYDNGTCSMCAIGSFQPLSGQTYCPPCTPGTTTETTGSIDSTQCKRVCDPGQYYSNEYDNCAPCPQGFYQNVSGLFYCRPCPVDKTTRQTGATSENVCFNDCPPGEELAENGTCTPCAIGFYKPGDQTLCGACDSELVTNTTGADSKDDCNVADNQAGFYRTRPDETQKAACPIGTYQPEKWQYDCISCGDGYRTDIMGSTSKDQCKFFCPAGQEKDRTMDKCIPCPIGFFRTGENPYSICEVCPNNTRTMTTGSKSESDCTIYKCSAGYRPIQDQDSCEKCPRGFYQPKNDQTDCLRCLGTMMDTRTEGSTELSQCEKYCESGYEKADNGTCVICPIGYYKSNTIDNFHKCTRCSDTRYVTPAPGATSETQCTILNCQAGHRIRGTLCEPCPQGTYQENPYSGDCNPCASGQSTRYNSSKLATDCESYCDPGKEKIGSECKICERGYYKNNQNNVFMDCTLCPTEFVTRSVGSFSKAECTIRNCTQGQFIDGDKCTLCDFGFYQSDPWQRSCLKCDTDRTTPRKGADNVTECILSCPPGKENIPGSNICTECQQGTYKSKDEASLCDKCRLGYTTRLNGSTSDTDCDFRACEAGSYANGNECKACAFGEYQPNMWKEQCIQCNSGFTTYQRGATSQDLCFLDCRPGQEYINGTCRPCSRGFYNDDLDPARLMCIRCPLDFITAGTGAISDRNCSVRNCTIAGQYLDTADNVCRDCPRGQWQNKKWQTACVSCNVGLTTRITGTSSKDDCIYDCPSGKRVDQNTTCIPCPKGSYRNKSESWDCDPCATGLTTAGTGANSRRECSISTCDKGFYFDNNPQVQRCERCPKNSYQDKTGQFTCKSCPDRTETMQPGATKASACIDLCKTTSNTCDQNAQCASVPGDIKCVCNDGYVGDGETCKDVCEVAGYCKNNGVCMNKKCLCQKNYEGQRCEIRQDPKKAGVLSEKDTIIVAVVTTLAFLLFAILLIVCCCVLWRKRQRNKVPFHNETSDERASIATRMSTRGYDDFGTAGYGTKPPSLPAGNRMMLPAQAQQMYENPTYTVNDGDPAVYKV